MILLGLKLYLGYVLGSFLVALAIPVIIVAGLIVAGTLSSLRKRK